MKSDLPPDVTPESHPMHHTVGNWFRGYNTKMERPDVFYCKSHDASGYNMVAEDDSHETNVSERAIQRTFWIIGDPGDRVPPPSVRGEAPEEEPPAPGMG